VVSDRQKVFQTEQKSNTRTIFNSAATVAAVRHAFSPDDAGAAELATIDAI
jgi:hypothetical protein